MAPAAARIGIRREDKSRWERRAPLTPDDVAGLRAQHALTFDVQRSDLRIFPDLAYAAAGARVVDALDDCPVVLAIKEIPVSVLRPGVAYLCFSHTIKRQAHNMPMLRRLAELGCTLIDYEKIVDERGRRLVFFGRHAGVAGMIDALWALGQRLLHEGEPTPLANVQRALDYDDVEHAKREVAAIGRQLLNTPTAPDALRPLVVGVTGYGHVAGGAVEILDALGAREISPFDLADLPSSADGVFRCTFREEHLVERIDAAGRGVPGFELREYYDHPDRYHGVFFPFAKHLTILVNGIYWEAKYPRLLTCRQIEALWRGAAPPRLRVIADISCDIEGSIEATVKATDPGDPVYVYHPGTGRIDSGVRGDGPVILAVDILPCELPVDSSSYFGQMLIPFMPALAAADFRRPFAQAGLPEPLERATILYNGELTDPYRYLDPELR